MLLLCSDGLTNTVSDREILAAAVQSMDPERLCRQLMETALQRGARDNVTVVSARK
jgi:protein phosphatase